MASSARSRLVLKKNPHFKRDGPKAYARALLKYGKHGLQPTQPGPYYISSPIQHQGKFGAAIGGRTRIGHSKLMKRAKPAEAPTAEGASTQVQAGDVPAEDVQHDSEYICEVAIGTPAQTLSLDFDTGSADLWVWSTKLPSSITSQYGSSHTIFDPSKSSSWSDQSGSTWKISYGDGSSASGTVGTDTVDLNGVTVQNQAIELADTLSTEFQSGAGDGLLGLAFPSINTVTPTPQNTVPANLIAAGAPGVFTAHLATDKDNSTDSSFYTFGYIDADVLSAANVAEADIGYTPVDNSQGFWQFDSASYSVNGKTVALSGNTAIADTGTTLALVSDDVCKAIYAAIPGASYNAQQQGWVIPSTTSVADYPTVQFAVGETLFSVDKAALSYVDVGDGTVYGGVQSRGSLGFDILGDTFLKGVYAVFDQEQTRFGCVQR